MTEDHKKSDESILFGNISCKLSLGTVGFATLKITIMQTKIFPVIVSMWQNSYKDMFSLEC